MGLLDNSIMAFFGLTALGPQNTFEEALPNQALLHIFSEIDFHNAFHQICKGSEFIKKNEMESFIRALYHGPAPEIDKNLIMTHIGNVESIRWEHVKKGFSKIELEIEARKKKQKSMKCTSYSEYRDLAHRHVRSKEGPDERLRKPLTVGQEFGWNIKCVEGPLEIKGRKSCPETIYADELAKSGIIY